MENNYSDKTENEVRHGTTRRDFLIRSTLAGIGLSLSSFLTDSPARAEEKEENIPDTQSAEVTLDINGRRHVMRIDCRATLLDVLRNKILLTGTKKGCDHGQCGACTVLANGKRVNSCLMLAAMCQDKRIVTIEGLADGDDLHPMQQAFITHDAFQCGYCTSGQICSAIGLVNEGHARTDAEIRELMSGNICRCGAYQNILEAVKEVQGS